MRLALKKTLSSNLSSKELRDFKIRGLCPAKKTFFRANRKHIVNLRMIDKVEPYFNGGLLLDLKGGEKIEVSRRQAVKFKEMMSL